MSLAGLHCIMHRIGRNVAFACVKADFDHSQVVDMLKMITDLFLGLLDVAVMNHQVSCGSHTYLFGNMSGKNELSLIPTDFDLTSVSGVRRLQFGHTYSSAMNIQVMTLYIAVEVLRVVLQQERYICSSIVATQEDV